MTGFQLRRIDQTEIQPETGLNDEQVSEQRKRFGKNELTPPEREPWWRQFLEKFDDPTIKILLVAAFISLLMTCMEKYILRHPEVSFIDAIGIFLAVFLATFVGYLSERKSAREFELLNKIKEAIPVKVKRNGRMTEVPVDELVVGDVVRLDLGDKVPADGVVIDALGLLVDQSLLTGESIAVEKNVFHGEGDLLTQPIDETMRVARGTMVTDGHGTFLVTAVGDATQMGKIAETLKEAAESNADTPLKQKLSRLAKQISVIGVSASTAIFTVMAVSLCWKSPLVQMFWEHQIQFWLLAGLSVVLGVMLVRFVLRPFFASMDMEMTSLRLRLLSSIPMIVAFFALTIGFWGFTHDAFFAVELLRELLVVFVVAVTIIVVAVPEGLPMMVTVSLAMNMMKMARENCLVRKLIASETIGSATVICSDKTGTLTQNRMQPVWFLFGIREYNRETLDRFVKTPEWTRLIDAIAINSEANLKIDGTKAQGIGNPTESALLAFLHEQGIDYNDHREKYHRDWELSHNSERKMSLVFVEHENGHTCHIKGAPEKVIDHCATILIDGKSEPIEPYRDVLFAKLRDASEHALRVIAFSERHQQDHCETREEQEACIENRENTLLGLIGIADPIRPEVPGAVETCRGAGIQVKMITGDALPTAVAIARQAKILTDEKTQLVLTSEDFSKVSDKDLPDIAEKLRVLARSTPMDKLRLVRALHHQGEVVAMTGDGTNDAPALKYADVGLSMGISGTEVAKEASDIVLVDDNFKSIMTGVLWGRTLYQNIQRFLQFQLSVNVVALTCALIGPLVGLPLPFTVPQLLWINIIMDTFGAIALSTDPPRRQTMQQKPIPRSAHIITPAMGVSILINSFYQVIILFTALYLGWFLDAEHKFQFFADPRARENLEALTVFFTIFIMFQFWHKFNCRALRHDESPFALFWKNRLFLLIVFLITFTQFMMVQASDFIGIGEIFRTVPLSLNQWLEIMILTGTIIPVAWFSRMIAYFCGGENIGQSSFSS